MNQSKKHTLLTQSKCHINHVQKSIVHVLDLTEKNLKESIVKMRQSRRPENKTLYAYVANGQRKKVDELKKMQSFPYFSRCDIKFEDDKKKSFYFGKFSFIEKSIYSWVAPVSVVRFENLGTLKYKRPDGEFKNGRFSRKDQYMIVDGKIIFFTTESLNNPRELVYQEYFSDQRKKTFALPEIVAQMEKAQDTVIRAHRVGPFLITGPAGSGKTTLALHRVAYLVQSPDTTEFYPEESIIVFVQDESTKQYFSQLLPRLGINKVIITTFAEWAIQILEFDNIKYTDRYGENEKEEDLYAYHKLKLINQPIIAKYTKKNAFSILENFYSSHFDIDLLSIYKKQKKEKTLDRLDLTILLKSYYQTHNELSVFQEYYEEMWRAGRARKKKGRIPLDYSLIVVDEFQNYLPCELELIRLCNKKDRKSIIYAGDAKQQIFLGTAGNLSKINEVIKQDRKVILRKVYRNAKSILSYLQNIGYDVVVPETVEREGEVVEKIISSQKEELECIEKTISKDNTKRIGILAKNDTYLVPFKEKFKKYNNIHILDMVSAQGVEFDTVFIVGIKKDMFEINFSESYHDLENEKKKIYRDLLYMVITRAVNNLYIFGECSLRESTRKLFEY